MLFIALRFQSASKIARQRHPLMLPKHSLPVPPVIIPLKMAGTLESDAALRSWQHRNPSSTSVQAFVKPDFASRCTSIHSREQPQKIKVSTSPPAHLTVLVDRR